MNVQQFTRRREEAPTCVKLPFISKFKRMKFSFM
jgi:hypothetical protein